MGARESVVFKPQEGPQEAFLSTSADIAIYGGAAGGGKTYGLLLEPVRSINNPGFGAVIFRRELLQITNEGGLWDEANGIYPMIGGRPRSSPRHQFNFPSGARVTFAHLNYEADVLDWQGAQIPLIGFDELTHFSRAQFFYMLSRNRSTCGVRPYVRATCNPDADSWVAEFIAWWIDQETGYPIPERSGVIRWFARIHDAVRWGDSPEELAASYGIPLRDCKSVTFIASTVYDNKILLAKDPGYVTNLKSLARVERERLLGGNWKIRPAAGLYFLRGDVTIIDDLPLDITLWARGWDLAATEQSEQNADPDWSAGVKLGLRKHGRYVIADVARVRCRADDVRKLVRGHAQVDGKLCRIRIPQDPGQAGKDQAAQYVRFLAGFPVFTRQVTGDKVTRALPFAAQWQAGNVEVLRAPWNEEFFGELEAFPDEDGHDDQVDAVAEAFAAIPALGDSVATAGATVFGSNPTMPVEQPRWATR